MKIGINEKIEPEIIEYYESFYDVLRTPDFDDKSRLLKPMHGTKEQGCAKNKKCRFCDKDENEASFNNIAHVFPESIGNDVLISNYECDDCNQYFGNTIENEYANFFGLYHSVMQIQGKNGVPKCKFKVPCEKRTDECAKYCVEISLEDNIPHIRGCREVDKQYINLTNDSITISKPVGRCCPIAVYKAIVKMAVSVMPVEELHLFKNVITWICEPEHSNFYNDKKLLVRYKMIPGFNVTKYPHYMLYRRKKDAWNKPYMLFNLTYGCYSLLIEVPRDSDNCTNSEFEYVPFPPIPFYTNEEGTWDMSEKEIPKSEKHSITLSFGAIKEYTDNHISN